MNLKAALTGIITSSLINCAHLSEPVKPDYCLGEEIARGEVRKISSPELYQCAEHYYERARLSELLRDRIEVQRYCDLALENLDQIPGEERVLDYTALEKGILDLRGEARQGEKY